jgi:hypothetical protein
MVQLNQRAACSRLLLEAPSSTGEIVDANKVLQESPRLLCTDNALQVVLSDRLDVPSGASGGPFSGSTQGGVSVDCDVLLAATGISYNSSFMKPHLADALDEQGRINVRCAGREASWCHAAVLHLWLLRTCTILYVRCVTHRMPNSAGMWLLCCSTV